MRKHLRRLHLYTILSLLCCLSPLAAQNQDWMNFTAANGIYNLYLAEDSLWIGTGGGLTSYNLNTSKMSYFNKANSPLPSNEIRDFMIDSQGNKWIGTKMGLVKISNNNWQIFNEANSILLSERINTITEDIYGIIWIGTSQGIVKYEQEELTFSIDLNRQLLHSYTRKLLGDQLGIMWAIDYYGRLLQIENDSVTVYDNTNPAVPIWWAWGLCLDKDNNLWFLLEDGIVKYDRSDFTLYDQNILPFNVSGLNSIFFDGENNMVIGHSNEILLFNGTNFIKIADAPAEEYYYLLEDEYNQLWLGSFWNGLFVWNKNNWSNVDIANSGFTENYVNRIIYSEEFESYFFMQTNNDLVRYNGNKWITFDTDSTKIPSEQNHDIVLDNNNFWIATWDTGLVKFNFKETELFNKENSPLKGNSLYALAIDKGNNLWISYADHAEDYYGLAKYDGGVWTLYDFQNSPIPERPISSLAVDHNNVLWIGTDSYHNTDAALIRFDGNIWTVYDQNNSNLPKSSIRIIKIDNNNNIWLGTYLGIVKYNHSNWVVYDIDAQYGFDYSGGPLDIDQDGNIWIGTWNEGIAYFDFNDLTIFNESNSALPDNFIRDIFVDKDQNVLIATNGGLAIYNDGGIKGILNRQAEMKKDFTLYHNYPNPFNNSTFIPFRLKKESKVKIILYDLNGKKINTVFNGKLDAGYHEFQFNSENLASGMYFYMFSNLNNTESRKMILVK